MKNKSILFSFILVVAAILAGYFLISKPKVVENNNPPNNTVNNTVPDPTAGWKTFTDPANGASFKYPATIGTTYINTVDWPPKVEVTAGPFTCTEAGTETEQAGQTTKETINGHVYCVTRESEGAAGSTYINYAYAEQVQTEVVIFTFSLREVQCDNYDDPQKTACKTERASFDISPIIDHIAQTYGI